MIQVRYKARLGNNLFQYCLGRILAEGLGWALDAEAIPGFPRTRDAVAGKRFTNNDQFLTGQRVDLKGILENQVPRRIILDGWFQRHEYYRPHRDRIRQWLQFDPAVTIFAERPDVVIHVRRTDYVSLGWALPYSFYEAALEKLSPIADRPFIMTDDPLDPFFNRFSRWKPRFATGTPLEQMAFMASAKRLVISQSTFSWWPTFIGNHAEVICPVPSHGMWADDGTEAGTSLIERDRFTCLECRDPYVPTDAEIRHQWWRSIKRRAVDRVNRALRLSLPTPPP